MSTADDQMASTMRTDRADALQGHLATAGFRRVGDSTHRRARRRRGEQPSRPPTVEADRHPPRRWAVDELDAFGDDEPLCVLVNYHRSPSGLDRDPGLTDWSR